MTTINRYRALTPLLLGLFAVFTPACGDSGPSRTTAVADLSDADAKALCEEFMTGACSKVYPPGDPACGTCHPCAQATSPATIRQQCGFAITVGGVRDCIDSGFDMPTCTGVEKGGCMFDVADELCQ